MIFYSQLTETIVMMEFIVLGQVPGTGLVVSFSWVVATATIFAGYSFLKHEQRQRELEQKITVEEQAI
jgi:hypothetical protein